MGIVQGTFGHPDGALAAWTGERDEPVIAMNRPTGG